MRRTARPWAIEVRVEGLNLERFVRQAAEHGLRLSGMRRPSPRKLIALVQESDLHALQELAVQGGWTLSHGSRKGAGRAVEWLHRRWLLGAAVLAGGIALLMATQVVWDVQIVDGGTYAADIRTALTELGVEAPMLRSRIDLGALKDALEWRYPRIAWFECGWRGTTLVIRPEEGVLPRTDNSYDGSCDVVAARDGIIHSVVTKAGTPVVKAGDIVRAGDVLIKGEERTSEGSVRPVAARGSVTARVWEGASVRMSAYETVTAYTGNQETVWTLRTPWFDLWQMGESGYAQYDVSVSETPICGIFIPVKLRVETRLEAVCTTQLRNMDDLEADAYEAAVRKLQEKLGPEESLIDIWGNCSMIDDENVLSVAIGERLVEIGVTQSSSGMAASGSESDEEKPR